MTDQAQNRRIVYAALLSGLSALWSLSAACVALLLSGTHSPSLIGFGLAALIDAAASVVLAWYFREWIRNPVRAKRFEGVAMRAVGFVLLTAAAYVVVRSISQLRAGSPSDVSMLGVVVALVSVGILPLLAAAKLRLAARIPSVPLRSDGILTAGSALLAGMTIVAVALEGGWWWLDPAIALAIACGLAAEGARTVLSEVG
jgi:divalent metal cation (Fe/Co/Zn/Cd) transporter